MFQNFSDATASGEVRSGVYARPTIAEHDHLRLVKVAGEAVEAGDANAPRLLTKIRAAQLCAQDTMPDDVVSMGAFVTVRTVGGRSRTRAIIYPEEQMWAAAEISVLTPLGTALLGQRCGDHVLVEAPVQGWGPTVLIERVGPRRMLSGFVSIGSRVRGSDAGRASALLSNPLVDEI